jgi:undecaprenol kinase
MVVGTNSNKTRIDSFRFASGGLRHALINQRNFQIQLVVGIIVVISAWLLQFSRIEWLILLITVVIVLSAELLNTVVEVVVDLAVKEQLLPDAKLAKDVAAAAVLLTSIFAVILGLILFIPHFL